MGWEKKGSGECYINGEAPPPNTQGLRRFVLPESIISGGETVNETSEFRAHKRNFL